MRRLLASAALAIFAPAAFAFTPESGFYWNPAESGSGLAIEIQDNFVFLTGYVYDTTGRPTWVSAQGALSGNSRFVSTLNTFTGGPCIGCSYTAPVRGPDAGGITIDWSTETQATLTWGGRTTPLTRFDFYLTRTAGIDQGVEKLLGEWQIVMDFFTNPSDPDFQTFPFFGEVLVFDGIDPTETPDHATGCRPRSTVYTLQNPPCSAQQRAAHDAAGTAATVTLPNGFVTTHVFTVTDDASESPDVLLAYYVKLGTYQMDGFVEACRDGQCASPTGRYYPVRGFRTASRSFIQTGTGPSSTDKAADAAPTRSLTRLLAAQGKSLTTGGYSAAEVKAMSGIDIEALRPVVESLHKPK